MSWLVSTWTVGALFGVCVVLLLVIVWLLRDDHQAYGGMIDMTGWRPVDDEWDWPTLEAETRG